MKHEYKIVTASTSAELEDKINSAELLHFEPLGGVSVSSYVEERYCVSTSSPYDEIVTVFAQAMTRSHPHA